MKDWKGNHKTTFTTLGASSHTNHKRAERDYYATPSIAGEHLLKAYPKINNIWECSCGEGSLSAGLKKAGIVAMESDIVVRGYPCDELDFLQAKDTHNGWIVINPPYSLALEFVEKALELANDGVAMFLRIQFLESQKRQRLFQNNPPSFVYVYSKRCPQCALNGVFANPTGNATTYCWFIWDKSIPKQEPIIRWVNV